MCNSTLACKKKEISLIAHTSPTNPYVFSLFSKPLLYLSASLYLQTGIKWLLTEGDKLLISAFATLEDQGTYALSANYGGLIARMLFRPIEDSSRNLFAKLCASPTNPNTAADQEKKPNPNPSNTPNLPRAAQTLHTLLHLYTLLSLPLLTLGPTLFPLLLHLTAGPHWTSHPTASAVLATYSYCIPLLALNGVSEAFVAATASTAQLQRQSIWMGFFSAGFAVSAYVFLRVLGMGARGLVWANCVNMGLRVGFNLRFAKGYFGGRGVEFRVGGLVPGFWAMGGAGLVPGLLRRSEGWVGSRYGVVGELVRVAVVGGVFVGFV